MKSPAADIRRFATEALEALGEDRVDDLEDAMRRLADVGQPEDAGSTDEIEAALLSTRRLYEAVEREAARVADEIAHVQTGRRALDRYEAVPAKGPRALFMSA